MLAADNASCGPANGGHTDMEEITVVDFRSDTVTKPTQGMRNAMATAEVGDDVYGEDPTVNAFEKQIADEANMEAAVFVSSGTQSNLCALLSHCQRGDEVITGDHGHSFFYENAGAAVFAGVQMFQLKMDDGRYNCFAKDGNFEEILRKAVRPDNVHFPRTRVILVENTHMGLAVPPEYYKLLRTFVDDKLNHGGTAPPEKRVLIHCDGARIVNACAKFNVPLSTYTQYFDSISICFSKGLGAAMGSMLCGNKTFITAARKWRKAVGGGMRQVGILAAGCRYAWEHQRNRLVEDHQKARALAAYLKSEESKPFFEVEYPDLEDDFPACACGPTLPTNMVFVKIKAEKVQLEPQLPPLGRALEAKGKTTEDLFADFDVCMKSEGFAIGNPKYTQGKIRIICHLDTTFADVERLGKSLLCFAQKWAVV